MINDDLAVTSSSATCDSLSSATAASTSDTVSSVALSRFLTSPSPAPPPPSIASPSAAAAANSSSLSNQLFRSPATTAAVLSSRRSEGRRRGTSIVSRRRRLVDERGPDSPSTSKADVAAANGGANSGEGQPPHKKCHFEDTMPHYASANVLSVANRLRQSTLKDSASNSNGTSTSFKAPFPPLPKDVLPQKTQNTVRVIAQYLRNLGLHETVDALVEETGIKVENAHAARLREDILSGNWSNALETLDKCYLFLKQDELYEAKLLILKEEFFSLLFQGDNINALILLREYFPEDTRTERIRKSLTKFLFMDRQSLTTNSKAIVHRSRQHRRKVAIKIQRLLPNSFMLPPARLEELLGQAYKNQIASCKIHLQSRGNMEAESIFRDHECFKNQHRDFVNFGTYLTHRADVNCVQFSPDGTMLASGSTSSDVYIWKVNKDRSLHLFQRLIAPEYVDRVKQMSWSFDSRLLAVTANDRHVQEAVIFDAYAGTIHRIIDKSHKDFSFCAFFSDKSYLLAAGNERGTLDVYDIDRGESAALYSIEGFRIKCVYGMKDGQTVLASDSHRRLRKYRIDDQTEETLITEEFPLFYFLVHPTEKFVVLQTPQSLRLWDLETRTLVRNFCGSVQSDRIIHCCFGGPNAAYLASGTEDGFVYVWNLDNSQPIMKMKGHTKCVNAVAWHPTDHSLLVSASDDMTIKLWTLQREQPKEERAHGAVNGARASSDKSPNHVSNGANGNDNASTSSKRNNGLKEKPTDGLLPEDMQKKKRRKKHHHRRKETDGTQSEKIVNRSRMSSKIGLPRSLSSPIIDNPESARESCRF